MPKFAHQQFGVGFDILDQQNSERTVHGYGCYAPRFQFMAFPSGAGAVCPGNLQGVRRNAMPLRTKNSHKRRPHRFAPDAREGNTGRRETILGELQQRENRLTEAKYRQCWN